MGLWQKSKTEIADAFVKMELERGDSLVSFCILCNNELTQNDKIIHALAYTITYT